MGSVTGVDVDLFKGMFRETPLTLLRTLPLEADGEGLDLGVAKALGVEERSRTRGSLGGESSDNSRVSDMASASFAARPGDMVSRMDGEAARIVGSPGCATMISSESPELGILAIMIHQDIQVHVDVDFVVIVFLVG